MKKINLKTFLPVMLLVFIQMSLLSQDLHADAVAVPTGLDKKIFLDLRDINVVDVLKFLAVEGDLNIVTSSSVQGRSTLVLSDVKIEDALEIIVRSSQLAYEIRNQIIYIMTEGEYRQLYGKNYNDKRRVHTRTLQYAKPSYVLSALQAVQSAIGRVVIDEESGTVILIDTDEKIAEMDSLLDAVEKKMDTKIIRLQYAEARDVEVQLRAKLDAKAVGSILADERTNAVIITAYPQRMEEAIKMVHALDSQTKAVMVDVRILSLTLNPQFDFGIDWQKAFTLSRHKTLRNLNFRGAFDIASTVSTDANLGSVGRIAVGDITTDEFTHELKILKQVEETKVLANPKLTIIDRQEAKINIGDRIPYVVTTTTGTGNNVSVSEEIKFIDVGIQLSVNPVINDTGFIIMKIRPEISSQSGTLTTPAGASIPLVNTTFAETSVVVQDGVTVILGGLRRDDLSRLDKGYPFLMDIPVIGNLFKSKGDSAQRQEIVILITPTIILGDQDEIGAPISIKPSRLSEEAA